MKTDSHATELDGQVSNPKSKILNPTSAVRILGIDPGLNITGYGVLERDAKHPKQPRVIEAGVIRGTVKQSLTDRLVEIHRGVAEVIESLKPDVMGLEQLYSHVAHPRTSILMGHARGVICLAAAQAGIPVVHYPATQIKRILTGAGRASKEQMQRAIQRELRLPQLPEPPDVADALAVALCHYYLGRGQQETADAGEEKAAGPPRRVNFKQKAETHAPSNPAT